MIIITIIVAAMMSDDCLHFVIIIIDTGIGGWDAGNAICHLIQAFVVTIYVSSYCQQQNSPLSYRLCAVVGTRWPESNQRLGFAAPAHDDHDDHDDDDDGGDDGDDDDNNEGNK